KNYPYIMTYYYWIQSEKNKDVLVLDNFLFVTTKRMPCGKIYWHCRTGTCRVKAISFEQTLLEVKGEHLHCDDKKELMVYKMKEILQCLSLSKPFKPALEIYQETLDFLLEAEMWSQDQINLLPSFDSLRSIIYRWKTSVMPVGSLSEDTFDLNFFKYSETQNMLLYHEFGDDQMIILGDVNYIRPFSKTANFIIAMDGTFKSSSTSFLQVYIIHGFISEQSFPLVYCFLKGKSEILYTKMFSVLKNRLI
ncbi:hypothetical protein DMUE_5677, partial [Dictyocoela muelleri]